MSCTSPITAFELTNSVAKNGGKKVIFSLPEGQPYRFLELPCGRCMKCRIAKSAEWALRCLHESYDHEQSIFVTLTFDDEHLPQGETLVKAHHQKFIRSLRKRTKQKIRYYFCGEYGGKFGRPHYHAILFGYAFPDPVPDPLSPTYFTSELLDACWGKGRANFCHTSADTMSYCTQYVTKKLSGKAATTPDPKTGLSHYQFLDELTGEVIDRLPEYSNMSTKPALGENFYQKYKHSASIFGSDSCSLKPGVPLKVPRYYDRKYKLEHPERFAAVQAKREAYAAAQPLSEATIQRRETVEICTIARHNNAPLPRMGQHKGTGLTASELTSNFNRKHNHENTKAAPG